MRIRTRIFGTYIALGVVVLAAAGALLFDRVRDEANEGIEARVYYPQIVPDMEPYREHPGIDAGQPLERARRAAKTALSLPLHPGMIEDDVGRVADALRSAIRSTGGNGP